jgi:UPF0271 protein
VSPARSIDLNADLGESTEVEGIGTERALLDLVTTAHIACGGHAGDEATMMATVAAALERSVRVGAHPAYPDGTEFGRLPVEIDRDELTRSLCDQLRALSRVCEAAGTTIESVKAHGALYEEVAKGGAVYESLRDAVRATCREGTPLVLPSGCRAMATCLRDDLAACEEGFCDRAYRPDCGLVDLAVPGAVFDDPDQAAAQALSLARGAVVATDGSLLTLWVDTLCIHADTPAALAIAAAVRRVMDGAGFDVRAPARS